MNIQIRKDKNAVWVSQEREHDVYINWYCLRTLHENFFLTIFCFLTESLVSHEINILFENEQREGASLQESCACYQDELGCLL